MFRKRPIAAAVATGLGSGFLPVAPGTWGSLVTLGAAEVAFRLAGIPGLGALIVLATVGGVVAAHRAASVLGRKDPSEVVIDEVAGQAISVAGVYLFFPRSAALPFTALVLLSFFLFRVIDVLKPGPVGRAESLPGGVGIMADDVLGGLFVGLAMTGVSWLLRPLFS